MNPMNTAQQFRRHCALTGACCVMLFISACATHRGGETVQGRVVHFRGANERPSLELKVSGGPFKKDRYMEVLKCTPSFSFVDRFGALVLPKGETWMFVTGWYTGGRFPENTPYTTLPIEFIDGLPDDSTSQFTTQVRIVNPGPAKPR